MALRDVKNFQFLKDAIIQKYRNPGKLDFRGILYEPQKNPQSVFGRIYGTFRELIKTRHLPLDQYLDIANRSVLERLYLNLNKDPNLNILNKPESALENPQYQLSNSYYESQSAQLKSAQAQMATSVPTTVGNGTTSAQPSKSPTPPSNPKLIPKIVTSQSPTKTQSIPAQTGKIAEEEPTTMTTDYETHPTENPVPQAFEKAFKDEPEYKTNPDKNPPEVSTIVHPEITDTFPQTGKIVEEEPVSMASDTETHPDQILAGKPEQKTGTAQSLTEQPPLTTPATLNTKLGPTQIKPAVSSSRKINFPTVRSSLSNAAAKIRDFTSPAGPGLKMGLGRMGRNLGEMAKGLVGQATGPGLSRGASFLGRTGLRGIDALANTRANLRNTSRRISGIGSRLSSSSILKKGLIIILLGAFFLIAIIGGINSTSGTVPTGVTNPVNPTGSDIRGCKFTRAGSSQTIKSPILAGWISTTAAAAGIPAQVLASVAMHENPDFVANADNNHDSIKSGQYCVKGKSFCEKSGQVLHSISGQNDPCTEEEIADGARTAQAVGLMQLLDIYNPGKDLCSITENLTIAAAKLKADGLTSQPTQDQVNKAINGYYNSCTYGTYSYCNEVWQDLQSCQATPVASTLPTTGSTILNAIVNAASQITSTLSLGSDGLYDVKPGESGTYQCTYLVVDSYRAAGLKGMDRAGEGWVINMKNFFANTSGYQLAPANSDVRSLRPGDVVILEGPGSPGNLSQHASIIKSIDTKDNGTGTITTFDANNVTTQDKISVRDFKAVSASTVPTYAITGFGQVTTAI